MCAESLTEISVVSVGSTNTLSHLAFSDCIKFCRKNQV
jgi:hypothetical protein